MGELGKGLLRGRGWGALGWQLCWQLATVEPWRRESVGMWGLRGDIV